MGWFDDNSNDFLDYIPIYAAGDALDITGKRAQGRADTQSGLMAQQRAQAKANQLAMLGQMQGPSVTPQQEARIKALETESTRPMLEDPNYGFQVGQATRGGAQALSAIQNKQRASGGTGGFANVGSMTDVYDRVGGQLSQIAAQNQQAKDQKRDQAAQARQSIADGQISFNNAITQAKIAIESGDAQATQAAMQAAYSAREQIQQASKQMIFSLAGTVGGAMVGGPVGASAGSQVGSAMAGAGQPAGGWAGQTVGGASQLNDMNAGPQTAAWNRPFYSMGKY